MKSGNDKKKDEDKKPLEDEEDNNKIKELTQRIEGLENNYKRALADYQNLEKRIREERQEWIATSNKDLVLRLLPILDTLVLAEKHIKVKDEGLSLSIKQFLDILKTEGVERIDTKDKKFDPAIMECVEVEKGEEGKVIDEIRSGYLISGKVLRPALVNVGSAKQNQKE